MEHPNAQRRPTVPVGATPVAKYVSWNDHRRTIHDEAVAARERHALRAR
ncbi:hypothetical protein ACFQO4_02605 [Saliphagus sp. GCM10025334]